MTDTDPTTTAPAPAPPPTPPADAWTPPSKEEWERMQAAVAKANADQKAAREAALAAAKAAGATEAEQAAKLAAEQAAEAKYRPIIIDKAATAALVAAGADKPDRLLALIDKGKVTINADGSVVGLEAEIASLKKEWPELFRKPTPTAGQVGAPNTGGAAPKKTTAQLLADRMRGVTT